MTASTPDYILRGPEDAGPVVVSIPHTGTAVPPEIADTFASPAIAELPMTDWHLHDLYGFLPGLGVTLLHATWSRLVVDLNRPPDARPLYPGRFETGVVPETTFQGEPVFGRPPTAEVCAARVAAYHGPYHECLSKLLSRTISRHGHAVLVDAHSVASDASLVHGPLQQDIYLGDRDSGSCEPWLTETLAGSFTARGYSVARNAPYKGGYITARYGHHPGVQAVQIEMVQRVYMDEADPAGAGTHPRFAMARNDLEQIFAELLEVVRSVGDRRRDA